MVRPFWFRSAAIAALLLAVTGAEAPIHAQGLSISPAIGFYFPTEALVKASNGEEVKAEAGLSLGGRLGLRFHKRVGVEATGSYVASSLRMNLSDPNAQTEDVNLFFGTTRVTVSVVPYTAPLWLSLNGGASLVRRSGPAVDPAADNSDVGAVVGATAGINLGGISLYVGADSYLYGTQTAQTQLGATQKKSNQRDVQLSFGFGIPVGR